MSRSSYTIGTLVTRADVYAAMRRSFETGGFTDGVDWIQIDNTTPPQTDAYAGLNAVLQRAKSDYVILCHQDLLLLEHTRSDLDARLRDLDSVDPQWGLAGNAGGADTRYVVRRITDKHGENQSVGSFPHRVMSLDENFIVVRGGTRIGLSTDLTGFHFYGADICLIAEILGHSSWVIDFHLKHLGSGVTGPEFVKSEHAFRAKWQRALRDRQMQTPSAFVSLTGRNRTGWRQAAEEGLQLRLGRWRRSLAKRKATVDH